MPNPALRGNTQLEEISEIQSFSLRVEILPTLGNPNPGMRIRGRLKCLSLKNDRKIQEGHRQQIQLLKNAACRPTHPGTYSKSSSL